MNPGQLCAASRPSKLGKLEEASKAMKGIMPIQAMALEDAAQQAQPASHASEGNALVNVGEGLVAAGKHPASKSTVKDTGMPLLSQPHSVFVNVFFSLATCISSDSLMQIIKWNCSDTQQKQGTCCIHTLLAVYDLSWRCHRSYRCTF